MRRYTLARALKTRTRDWSPLALTSTNAGLMRNYLDGDAEPRTGMDSVPVKDGPVMRWRMRETEVRPFRSPAPCLFLSPHTTDPRALPPPPQQGGFWLGYRPIVRVELVTPSSFSNTAAYLPVVDPELGAPPEVLGLELDDMDTPELDGPGRPSAQERAHEEEQEQARSAGPGPAAGEGAAAGAREGEGEGEAPAQGEPAQAGATAAVPVVGEPPRYEDAH